jgi:hypothetical protein
LELIKDGGEEGKGYRGRREREYRGLEGKGDIGMEGKEVEEWWERG